jgi:hypothetical protein
MNMLQYVAERDWLDCVRRMKHIMQPIQLLDNQPLGRQRHGRPLQRLLSSYNLEA